MQTVGELAEAVFEEARRADFPIDRSIYEKAEKDPLRPVLYAGSLSAPVCVFGRDLGKDEVAVGEPLVGAGGRLVRAGLYEARFGEPPKKSDRRIEQALEEAILTNTVPYKPPGNKAYSEAVKERFRPFVAELLTVHWNGTHVITLGTEAFRWFTRYLEPGEADEYWSREDRYEASLTATLTSDTSGSLRKKTISVAPLPHPSPLNQRWYGQFPGLLLRRLAAVRA